MHYAQHTPTRHSHKQKLSCRLLSTNWANYSAAAAPRKFNVIHTKWIDEMRINKIWTENNTSKYCQTSRLWTREGRPNAASAHQRWPSLLSHAFRSRMRTILGLLYSLHNSSTLNPDARAPPSRCTQLLGMVVVRGHCCLRVTPKHRSCTTPSF